MLLMLAVLAVFDCALLLCTRYCHGAFGIVLSVVSMFFVLFGFSQSACVMLWPYGVRFVTPSAIKRGELHAQFERLKDAGLLREVRDAKRLYIMAVVLFYIQGLVALVVNFVIASRGHWHQWGP